LSSYFETTRVSPLRCCKGRSVSSCHPSSRRGWRLARSRSSIPEVALAAATAAHELGRDRFLLYFGLIRAALSEAAGKAFQMLPQGVRFYDESLQQSFDRGRAAEKAADVLEVLEARGLAVSKPQRERILATSDLELLTRWVRRAATITSSDALFE